MTEIFWTTAAPLYDSANGNLRKPSVLRFATDSFMDDFTALLQNQPERMSEFIAAPETWQVPVAPLDPIRILPTGLRSFQLQRQNGGFAAKATPAVPAADASTANLPLKLYHPAHMRHYLVTAGLVCRQAGMPDRVIDASAQEKVGFVVRRLMLANPDLFSNPKLAPTPDKAEDGVYEEYAFINNTWKNASDEFSLETGEEQNPLFAMCYDQPDGSRRRVLAGLVPVAKREQYMGAAPAPADSAGAGGAGNAGSGSGSVDPRLEIQLRRVFFGPWQHLVETTITNICQTIDGSKSISSSNPNISALNALRYRIQETSWYILLDFALFLKKQLPDMFAALDDDAKLALLPAKQKAAVNALRAAKFPANTVNALSTVYGRTPKASLAKALSLILSFEDRLEKASVPFKGAFTGDFPNFVFPLVDVADSNSKPFLTIPTSDISIKDLQDTTKHLQNWITIQGTWSEMQSFTTKFDAAIEKLRVTVTAALPAPSAARLPAMPLAAQAPARVNENGWFVIRCVFNRPNCVPEPEPLLSEPTAPFQLAGFFDPDAPARPIRISMPMDTSPAGLRKFDKNTAFMMSDMLCGQVKRARGMGLGDLVRSVLPFPLHKDLDVSTDTCKDGGTAFGMICSISIPIITICAFILLMIIVNLLDLIFRWSAFFIMCFPIPKFSAKES